MIAKLPRWMEFGAFALAFQAGLINALGLLALEHQAVSHVSGTLTLIGTGIWQSSSALPHLLGVVVSFLLGAMISGLLLNSGAIKLGRFYDLLLLIEAGLLLAAMVSFVNTPFLGDYFASAACGLQNAMVTHYSGAIVRTTHMTGIITDLGIMLGSVLRGRQLDRRKATLLLLILAGFVSGGFIGAMWFGYWQFAVLWLPVGLCLLLALAYRRMRVHEQRVTH